MKSLYVLNPIRFGKMNFFFKRLLFNHISFIYSANENISIRKELSSINCWMNNMINLSIE